MLHYSPLADTWRVTSKERELKKYEPGRANEGGSEVQCGCLVVKLREKERVVKWSERMTAGGDLAMKFLKIQVQIMTKEPKNKSRLEDME